MLKNFQKEFREFALKGNVLDLAVGVVIGGAFSKIVNSVVNDMIMPVIGLITGKIDFTNLFIAFNGKSYKTIAEAKAAGIGTLNYGSFITSIVDFILIAFSIFIFIKAINRIRPKASEEPKTKDCPYCFSKIALKAAKCPHCTSNLNKVEAVS